MKNYKKRLVVLAILFLLMLANILRYSYFIIVNNELTLSSVISIGVTLIISFSLLSNTIKGFKYLKKGLAVEDERSKKIKNRSAAISFFLSIYWLLAISMFEEFFAEKLFNESHLTVEQTIGGTISGMVLLFAVCWIYYNKKSDIN